MSTRIPAAAIRGPLGWLPLLALLAACAEEPPVAHLAARSARAPGQVMVLRDTTIGMVQVVAGLAQPLQEATLSSRLAGAITSVMVHEGDAVTAGQLLARIDDHDVSARRDQLRAAVADAEAVATEARRQAARIGALYADSAATRAQLDAAETGVARAEAALRMAQASSAELEAIASDAAIRAPFAGRIARRLVDPGDFVAPGVPIMVVQDPSRLRIVAAGTPGPAAQLRRGMPLDALIEGAPAAATLEGIVSAGGGVFTINAIVDNRRARFSAGSAAALLVPRGTRSALMVPARALVEQGDLIGVRVERDSVLDLRWVRVGERAGDMVEVLSGLWAGDRLWVPDTMEGNR